MPDDIVADADMRYMEAAVYDPYRQYKIDMIVISGHSNDIKKALATANFSRKLYDDYAKLLDLWEEAWDIKDGIYPSCFSVPRNVFYSSFAC